MNLVTVSVAKAGVSEYEVACTHWIGVDIMDYEPMSSMCFTKTLRYVER